MFRTIKKETGSHFMSNSHYVCRGARTEIHAEERSDQLDLNQDAATDKYTHRNSDEILFFHAAMKPS